MTAKLIVELNEECIENLKKEFKLKTTERLKEFLSNVLWDNLPLKHRSSGRIKAIVEVCENG